MSKKNKALLITGAILSFSLLLMSGYFFLKQNDKEVVVNKPTIAAGDVSTQQDNISDPRNNTETYEGETTDIVGYGELDITESSPYVYLQNPETNTVYMQFEVSYEDETIYISDLIEPGKQERLAVYNQCENGHGVLNYQITTYDVDTRELCMAGISQQQKINVIK